MNIKISAESKPMKLDFACQKTSMVNVTEIDKSGQMIKTAYCVKLLGVVIDNQLPLDIYIYMCVYVCVYELHVCPSHHSSD